jgi:DNA repair photolyase
VTISETEAKSILRKHKKIDSWFISRYGMNLYRGCTHNCVYCDGRSEGYYVEGTFGKDVTVKVNAVDILKRELDPKRKRTPFKRSFIMVGGGVSDSYQPIEKKYELTRRTLEVVRDYDFPVHMLTKSTLIERDIDILKDINKRSRTIISFSFSSVDDGISAVFEPGVPPPNRRLETIKRFKDAGIVCGMFLLPVIPFVTDSPEMIEQAVSAARDAGIDFIIFGGMTLKEGRQKDYFLNATKELYPDLAAQYQQIYSYSKWGEPSKEYSDVINLAFNAIARKYRMPMRIPPSLYRDILSENDLVIVMLEHIDYMLKMKGSKSSLGYAAYSLSQVQEPLSEMRGELRNIKGVGDKTADIILEILQTGTSSLYKQLLLG